MCVLPNRGLPPTEATGLYQPFGAAAGFCAGVHHTDEVADYQFNGNAIDAGGHNHGSITEGVSFVSDRNGVPNAAALFNGVDHFITVQAPFPNADTEFTIAVWLKPSSVDNSWHGFVGYHADLGDGMDCCSPHRSPSLWVARSVDDATALHYDSCEKNGVGSQGRVAGLIFGSVAANQAAQTAAAAGAARPCEQAAVPFFAANVYTVSKLNVDTKKIANCKSLWQTLSG